MLTIAAKVSWETMREVWENCSEEYRNREWMHNGICQDCKFWGYCEGNGMHLRDNNGELLLCNLHRLEADLLFHMHQSYIQILFYLHGTDTQSTSA